MTDTSPTTFAENHHLAAQVAVAARLLSGDGGPRFACFSVSDWGFLPGAWPVIGFLGLELLVVWGAFKLNYRAAQRRQHLTATTKKLKIENVSPDGDRETTEMPTAWVQVELTPREEPEMRSRQRRKIIAGHMAERPKSASFCIRPRRRDWRRKLARWWNGRAPPRCVRKIPWWPNRPTGR